MVRQCPPLVYASLPRVGSCRIVGAGRARRSTPSLLPTTSTISGTHWHAASAVRSTLGLCRSVLRCVRHCVAHRCIATAPEAARFSDCQEIHAEHRLRGGTPSNKPVAYLDGSRAAPPHLAHLALRQRSPDDRLPT